MIAQVTHPYNLQKALRQVGSAGVDGLKTTQLADYFREHKPALLEDIKNNRYLPQPILGVEIPKRRRKVPTLGNPNRSRQTASTSRVTSDDAEIRKGF